MSFSRRQLLLSIAAIGVHASWPVHAIEACPGVDPVTGTRPDLTPPAATPNPAPARQVPAAWRQVALELIALFESGRRNVETAYANVSATDVISLGYLQWNHNTGSLYSDLLKDASPEFITAAPEGIRAGIDTLIRVSTGALPRKKGRDVLDRWNKSGSIAEATRRDLATWLTSPPLRKRQDQLIDDQLLKALRLTDAWQRDLGLSVEGDAPKRAFYSFVDLQVFNGGDLAGLWVEHVRAFREQFATGVAMMDHLVQWSQSCAAYAFKGKVRTKDDRGNYVYYSPTERQLYIRKETPISVAEWRRLTVAGDPRLNEDALNLIALGFLRARISFGNDKPRGFHGVFQLNVLNRRGMMATGIGVRDGESEPTVLYSL